MITNWFRKNKMWMIFRKEWFRQKKLFGTIILTLGLGLYGFGLISVFRDALDNDAKAKSKNLLVADVTVDARRDLTSQELKHIQSVFNEKNFEKAMSISIFSMIINPDGKSRLASVRGITEKYPLYGYFNFRNGKTLNDSQELKANEVWVSKEYQALTKVQTGDRLKLGASEFRVSGIIDEDSSSSWQGVGVAPRIYIKKSSLENANLLGQGSIAWYRRYYKQKTQDLVSYQELKDKVFEKIDDPAIDVDLPDQGTGQVARVMGYLTDYLGLVALMALFLSAIGSFYLFQNFLNNRVTTVAVLSVLGSKKNALIKLYLSFLITLGSIGFLVALILLSLSLGPIESTLLTTLNLELNLALNVKTILLSFILIVAINLFACLPLLISLFDRPVSSLFSYDLQKAKNKLSVFSFAPLAIVFWVLSIWQSNSIKMGSFFFFCILISLILMIYLLPLFLKLIEKIATRLQSRNLPLLKLILFNFARKKQSTVFGFISITLGLLLVFVINQLDQSLRYELDFKKDDRPGLFLVDIQPEQVKEIQDIGSDENFRITAMSPMVRAKIKAINGKPYERAPEDGWTREEQRRQRFRNRGVNLSYAQKLNETESLISGRPFKAYQEGDEYYEVSLENRYAERMGIELNDLVTFDIMGIDIPSKVVNLRRVRWTSFRPNFFITFAPGAIEDAPKTYLATVETLSLEKLSRVQDRIVEKLPNVSIINVVELVTKILGLFSTLAITLKFMAYLSLLMGGIVIFSIALFERRNQQKAMLILETMGMKRSRSFLMVIGHFSLIYILSSIVSYLFSVVMSFSLARLYFDGTWKLFWKDELLLIALGLVFIFILFYLLSRATQKLKASILLQPN
jgi:putative ABC transport system permease protein